MKFVTFFSVQSLCSQSEILFVFHHLFKECVPNGTRWILVEVMQQPIVPFYKISILMLTNETYVIAIRLLLGNKIQRQNLTDDRSNGTFFWAISKRPHSGLSNAILMHPCTHSNKVRQYTLISLKLVCTLRGHRVN